MPTNDERREVAARLREVAPTYRQRGGDPDLLSSLVATVGTSVDSLFDRLAELIEPEERTCRDVSSGREFWCSECGFVLHLSERLESGEWAHVRTPVFCPNCGAKVVGQ